MGKKEIMSGQTTEIAEFINNKIKYRKESKGKCGKCGLERTRGEPDPCIDKYLPGIAHACCGHGEIQYAYCCGWPNCLPDEGAGEYKSILQIPGYWDLRGIKALDYMENLK